MVDHTCRLNSSLSDASFKLSCESALSKFVQPEQSTIDSILAHSKSETAEIVLTNGQKFMWYFAIGSMMNPVSLYLRDVTPIISYPAKCPNHQTIFRGPSGMADIEVCSEAEFHGVVHLLSDVQMARIDAIEMSYHRILVTCVDYQGQSQLVYMYKMNTGNLSTSLPSERYLDIIIKGCEYYKVQPEYINRLRDEQAVIPRKQPHTFQSFTDIPSDVFYSLEELARHNGSDPSLPLWISINGKILECTGLPFVDQSDYEAQNRTYSFLKSKFGGCEATRVMAKLMYEPLYRLPMNDNDDLCEQYRADLEDNFYKRIVNADNKNNWKPIGRLCFPNSLSQI